MTLIPALDSPLISFHWNIFTYGFWNVSRATRICSSVRVFITYPLSPIKNHLYESHFVLAFCTNWLATNKRLLDLQESRFSCVSPPLSIYKESFVLLLSAVEGCSSYLAPVPTTRSFLHTASNTSRSFYRNKKLLKHCESRSPSTSGDVNAT